MKSGLGTASITLPNGLVVAAIVAVNAVGDIIDPRPGRSSPAAQPRRHVCRRAQNAAHGRQLATAAAGENTTIAWSPPTRSCPNRRSRAWR